MLKMVFIRTVTAFLFAFAVMLKSAVAGNSLAGDQNRHSRSGGKEPVQAKPVAFMENRGQVCDMNGLAVPSVLFKAEAMGLDLYITSAGLTYVFYRQEEEDEKIHVAGSEDKLKIQYERVDMRLAGSHIIADNIVKESPLQGHYNFFGSHCGNGIYGVQKFGKITISEVYPGIDWVLYGSEESGFKYDFVVQPGADASQVQLSFLGSKKTLISEKGELIFGALGRRIAENPPVSYQGEPGSGILSEFRSTGTTRNEKMYECTFGFHFPDGYDHKKQLVIDPQVTWGTFFGGANYEGTYVTETDKFGNLFLAGYLSPNNFPLFNAGTYYSTTGSGFITKFSPAGALLWSTLYPAGILGLTCNNAGDIYVCGGTSSTTGIPLISSGGFFQGTAGGLNDAFITRFDNSGNLNWSTYYGGTGTETFFSLACDAAGNVFVCGNSSSTNCPVQNAGTFFIAAPTVTNSLNGIIAKFSSSDNLVWGTYYDRIGGEALTVDKGGNLLLTGTANGTNMPTVNPGGGAYFQGIMQGINDGYAIKFDNTGNILWGTYFGGNAQEQGRSITTDKNGNIIIGGFTTSTSFPVLNAGGYFKSTAYSTANPGDTYIAKFTSSGVLLWSTFFGGTQSDTYSSSDNLDTDTCGNIYLAFESHSRNLPFTQPCDGGYFDNSLDTSVNTGNRDICLARFTPSGALSWCTYIGGSGDDFRSPIDISNNGYLYVSGEWFNSGTLSANYPVKNSGGGAYTDTIANGGDDVFIMKFQVSLPPQSFSYTAAKCQSDSSFLPLTSSGFATGGTFSASAGLSINPVNGKVDPSNSAAGVYSVTYLLSGNTPSCSCAVMQNPVATLTVLANPILSISPGNSVCAGSALVMTVTGATGYTWNTGAHTNTLSVSPSTTTTFTITGAIGACSNTISMQLIVGNCTGILQRGPLDNFEVFPNPNNGEFIVRSPVEMELQVFNVSGQEVAQTRLSASNNFEAGICNLRPGVYMIRRKGDQSHGLTMVVH
jgi:hypothetical protein